MTEYSVTIDYYRVGVGDMIALDPSGGPYHCFPNIPTGFSVNYWYSTHLTPSTRDPGQWTKWDGAGSPPAGARWVTVNILSITGAVPAAARVEYTVSGLDYKGSSSARAANTGSDIPFAPPEQLNPPDLPNLAFWFDLEDADSMFTDAAGTQNVTPTDTIVRIANKGYAGGFVVDESSTLDYTTSGTLAISTAESTSEAGFAYNGLWNENFAWAQPVVNPFPEWSIAIIGMHNAITQTGSLCHLLGTAQSPHPDTQAVVNFAYFNGAAPFFWHFGGGNPAAVPKSAYTGYGSVSVDNWYLGYAAVDNAVPSTVYSSVNADQRSKVYGAGDSPDEPFTLFGGFEQQNGMEVRADRGHILRLLDANARALSIFAWNSNIHPFIEDLRRYALQRLGQDPDLDSFPIADS
jgi:hypothetical protein